MDTRTWYGLALAARLYLQASLIFHGVIVFSTILFYGLSIFSPSLFLGIFLSVVAESVSFAALALVCRPDSQPPASLVGFQATAVPFPSVAGSPASRFSSFSNSSKVPSIHAVADGLVQAATCTGFVALEALAVGLGTCGLVQTRNAAAGLSRAPLQYQDLRTISWVAAWYCLAGLLLKRHVLKQPVIQRSSFRKMKLALPRALMDGCAFGLALLCFSSSASPGTRSAVAFYGLLQLTLCGLARAAYQAAFTEPSKYQASGRQLLHSLLTPDSLSPVQQPRTSLSPTSSPALPLPLFRFALYSDCASLCHLSESCAPACSAQRQDIFASQELYIGLVSVCLSRVDQMTARVRDRLGCPLEGGASRLLACSFPALFLENPKHPPPAFAAPGMSPAALGQAPLEAWPASSTFFDLKLCEWSARTVAALTLASLSEDQQGTAQLSGSNAAALSCLLSALLACEELAVAGDPQQQRQGLALLPFLQLPGLQMRWSLDVLPGALVNQVAPWLDVVLGRGRALSSGAESGVLRPRPLLQKVRSLSEALGRGGPVCAEAVVMADVLRSCVYRIGDAFRGEIVPGWKASVMGGSNRSNAWFDASAPVLFGTHADHLEKLHQVLLGRTQT